MLDARALYLDLLKRALLDVIHDHTEYDVIAPQRWPKRSVTDYLGRRGMQVVRPRSVDEDVRREGRQWPQYAHTMVGLRRLDNVQECVTQVVEDGIEGDLIEAGVWRGGTSIFMRGVLAAYGVDNRKVWVADSFRGLPPPDPDRYPADDGINLHLFPELAVSLEQVQRNFERYGLLDDQVEFLEGWFKDTLPDAPIDRLAVIRLDGDLYESTIDTLAALYPKLSPGGFLIVDDYSIPACKAAVADFRREHDIGEPLVEVDWTAVYWRRA